MSINNIQEVLDVIIKFNEKYKGIYFRLINGSSIYLKFDPYSIPHSLGLNRVSFFKNKGSAKNIYNYLKNNGLNLETLKKRKVSKKDLKIIVCKIDSIIKIVNFFYSGGSPHFIKIGLSGSFVTHDYDWIIAIDDSCLVLKEHSFKESKKSENFSSCCLLSIRNLNCFKKDKIEIPFDSSLQIEYWKFTEKTENY